MGISNSKELDVSIDDFKYIQELIKSIGKEKSI